MINEPTNEQKAILNYNGNTVVTANPGSGKTYTVVEKIGKVLHDLPSYKGIIAISFTNKASDELKKRCKRKGINAKSSFFGTIDKFYISEIIIPFASHLTHVMPEYQVVESTETEKHYSELGMITENVTKEQGALLKEALCKGKIFLNILLTSSRLWEISPTDSTNSNTTLRFPLFSGAVSKPFYILRAYGESRKSLLCSSHILPLCLNVNG